MSSFPPKNWQVRHLDDFDQYEVEVPPKAAKLHMEALLVAKPARGQEGTYRLALGGAHRLLLEMKVTDVFNDKAFEGMTVMADIQNGSIIKLQKNSVTTRWCDVEELVRAQEVDVIDEHGEDKADLFLETWDRLRQSHWMGQALGCIWRWGLSASEDGQGMEMLVQALPVNLNHMKNHSELRQVKNTNI